MINDAEKLSILHLLKEFDDLPVTDQFSLFSIRMQECLIDAIDNIEDTEKDMAGYISKIANNLARIMHISHKINDPTELRELLEEAKTILRGALFEWYEVIE